MTTPLAMAIRRHWPRTRIAWVVQPLPGRLLEGSPAVDELIPFERLRGRAAIAEYAGFRRRMKPRAFDLLLCPQKALKAGILTGLLNAPVKVGFDRARSSDLHGFFTTHAIPASPRRHKVDETLEFAHALGIPAGPVEWGLRTTSEERSRAEEFLAGPEPLVCGIVVGTSHPGKNWPAERWIHVVDALAEQHGARVVLLGGPSREEGAIAASILEGARNRPTCALGNDLRHLMALLEGCDLVLSPDTGPLHIAVALGTPVVGLYGRTNPNLHGPWGPSRPFVADGFERAPGEAYGNLDRYRDEGMSRITPEMVLLRVGELLRVRGEAGPASAIGG